MMSVSTSWNASFIYFAVLLADCSTLPVHCRQSLSLYHIYFCSDDVNTVLYMRTCLHLYLNRSIKFYLLSNNNENYNTACERSKGCQRSNTLIELTNKITHMNTNKKGKRQKGYQTMACALQVQVQTTNSKSTLCVHCGLKYDNLSGRYLDIIHYITLDRKSTTILTYSQMIEY